MTNADLFRMIFNTNVSTVRAMKKEDFSEWLNEEQPIEDICVVCGNSECMFSGYAKRQNCELFKLKPTMQSFPRWIPVSERLPKEGSYVLVCCKDGLISTDDYFSYGFDDWNDDVVAWMPLPAPYEGSNTE